MLLLAVLLAALLVHSGVDETFVEQAAFVDDERAPWGDVLAHARVERGAGLFASAADMRRSRRLSRQSAVSRKSAESISTSSDWCMVRGSDGT